MPAPAAAPVAHERMPAADRGMAAGILALVSSVCIVAAVAADRYGDSWEQVSRDRTAVIAGDQYMPDNSNNAALSDSYARISNNIRNGAIVGAGLSGIGSLGFGLSALRRRRV